MQTPTHIQTLAQELQGLNIQKNIIEARQKEIKAELIELAVFEGEKKSTKVYGTNLIAKVEKKESIKWDTEKLNIARQTLGEEVFWSYFKYEYKHKQKSNIDAMITTPAGQTIKAAMTSTFSNYVTIEEIEE